MKKVKWNYDISRTTFWHRRSRIMSFSNKNGNLIILLTFNYYGFIISSNKQLVYVTFTWPDRITELSLTMYSKRQGTEARVAKFCIVQPNFGSRSVEEKIGSETYRYQTSFLKSRFDSGVVVAMHFFFGWFWNAWLHVFYWNCITAQDCRMQFQFEATIYR